MRSPAVGGEGRRGEGEVERDSKVWFIWEEIADGRRGGPGGSGQILRPAREKKRETRGMERGEGKEKEGE